MLAEVTVEPAVRPSHDLSVAQQEAVDHDGPRLLVRGPAGSGKTTVIAARFARLVADGSAPEQIGVLVPTAARADLVRDRLQRGLTGGYDELVVLTPADLATRILAAVAPSGGGWGPDLLGPGDRLALLAEHIEELTLRHHDLGGRPVALLGSFVRRIDRLKGELVDAACYRDWAAGLDEATTPDAAREREFAEIYLVHERLLARASGRDDGNLIFDALGLALRRPDAARGALAHLLLDDAQELDLAASRLALALGVPALTVAGDPDAGVRALRAAGAQRLAGIARSAGEPMHVVALVGSHRCPPAVQRVVVAALGRIPDVRGVRGVPGVPGVPNAPEVSGVPQPRGDSARSGGAVELWRCADSRSQAQSVAVDIERLVTRGGVAPGAIAVIVPEVAFEGQALGVALEERAIPQRVVGETVLFARAEIRDLLAWLRLLADPTDAAAVVRALARPPIALRSVDIARCTQIARRRKVDMVSALAAALESPQIPPEARDRIRNFLGLYDASGVALDSSRPDLYVHRLIDRLGLRRQGLFAARADVVARLRALAAFGDLAAAHAARAPQSTPREFARSVAAVAEVGLGRQEEPELGLDPGSGSDSGSTHPVQILTAASAGGLEVDHVYVVGVVAGLVARPFELVPDALLDGSLPPDSPATRERALRQELALAAGRARRRLVLAYPRADDRGEPLAPAPILEEIAEVLGAPWQDRGEELFGPTETLHSTYRLLRDELLEGTTRAAGRLGELRLDTDLDVSHAVVRYLELLKVAALLAAGEPDGAAASAAASTGPERGAADALRDINARISQAVTADQREIFDSSPLDDYLLDAERGSRGRAQALAARDEPSLAPFLPLRGEGVVMSAGDIDTYRACPLKYKFARVLRIPQEPTLHQRFGILVHQVLERYHAPVDRQPGPDPAARTPGLSELLGLLDAGWRRGGFGDSQPERQLRGKASVALTRYHRRFASESAQPVWFERQFTFPLGPHLLRGRVDRVDRLPGGEYELIDYKTGRPKSAAALAEDVQLSLYAVGARESWRLDASRQAYYYLLDDEKVAVPDDGNRGEWVREVATEVAAGIRAQDFEPTPSLTACSLCDYRLLCPAAER
jgi:DNA helicase-2/ATP-dependent DNA helicase PcrA